jgi:monoamine oxidase
MSRPTKLPFLRTLLRAAEEARLDDKALKARLSRRAFLKSSALLTGVAATNIVIPNISWSQRKSRPRIAIVGAGIAGLTAAYELRKKGIIATVYEANSRIGGRIMTTRDQFGPNLYTEFGGEFIDTGHKEIRRLVQELNLSLVDVKPESQKHLSELLYFDGKHRTHEDLVNAFKPIATKLATDAATAEDDPHYRTLDRTNLEYYIATLNCEEWLKRLLRTAFVIEYGLDAAEQSALNMLSMLDTDVSDSKVELYGESDERYRINGGNDLITKGLARRVEDQIEHGHWLTSISEKGSAYSLTFEKDKTTKQIDADILILAIPFTMLRQVERKVNLGFEKSRVIEQLGYGRNAKIIFGVRKSGGKTTWQRAGSNGAMYSDLWAHSGWDSAPMQSDMAASYTVYLGGSNATIASGSSEAGLTDLEVVMPGFADSYNEITKSFAWHEYKYSLASYTCYKPGQWSMAGSESKPVNNIYFAGEHCSVDHQGFMEGAAETGVRAAASIASMVKR